MEVEKPQVRTTYVSVIEVTSDGDSVILHVTARTDEGLICDWLEHAYMVDGVCQSDVFAVQVVDVETVESEAAA